MNNPIYYNTNQGGTKPSCNSGQTRIYSVSVRQLPCRKQSPTSALSWQDRNKMGLVSPHRAPGCVHHETVSNRGNEQTRHFRQALAIRDADHHRQVQI